MSVYIIAALDKHNPKTYAEYVVRGQRSLEPYPDSRVAADDAPTLIEGVLPAQRFVLLKFKDDAEFDAWYNSDAYQKALPYRQASADTRFLVKVRGHG
jgi:uncharacterized protein (DUF1330 family)